MEEVCRTRHPGYFSTGVAICLLLLLLLAYDRPFAAGGVTLMPTCSKSTALLSSCNACRGLMCAGGTRGCTPPRTAGSVTAVLPWPLVARAQQPERVRRIDVLMAYAESDPEGQALVAAFREGPQTLGRLRAEIA